MRREDIAQKIRWDFLIRLVGIINPLATAPQLWKLWSTKETAGISPGMLATILFIQVGFATHGFFLRDRTLFISNTVAGCMTLSTLLSYLYLSA